MERLHSVKVVVEIDTNKDTYVETFELGETQSVSDLMKEVDEWLEEWIP